jgi:hypothetical protein
MEVSNFGVASNLSINLSIKLKLIALQLRLWSLMTRLLTIQASLRNFTAAK